MDNKIKEYYERERTKLSEQTLIIPMSKVEQLSQDISTAIEEFMIKQYGANPISRFEDDAPDIIFNILLEKYG